MEPLQQLKLTEPPQWIAPSESLSKTARAASQHLFSLIKPHVHKSPFEQLLVDRFDAEQIWQQIDLQSQPLLSGLKRQVKHWEKHPDELESLRKNLGVEKKAPANMKPKHLYDDDDDDVNELDDDDMDGLDDNDDEEEEEEDAEDGKEKGSDEQDSGDEEEEDDDSSDDKEEEEENRAVEIEDKFLKVNELKEYLEEGDAREYGLDTKKMKNKDRGNKKLQEEEDDDDDDQEDDENEDNEDEEDDELGMFDDGDDEDEEANKLANARYEDFFGKKKKESKQKPKQADGIEGSLGSSDEDEMEDKQKSSLSTHEKQVQKHQAEIEQMERANLEPKDWTMRGEVTASSRPKNSALEVDIDFEHNARPAPVITEEVTASLEDMIKNRIIEGQFDDVQKVSALPSKAPREVKELDENKSKKGLAEVYEEEYVQTTNPAAAPTSFTDEQKKESRKLFKNISLKLDALSHFHFAPKPVIEDMSIETNVPALAMEEIAPMAVSDAAMLAPEEVFSGKGDIKEEAELTQSDRKRRRAKKKRKFKAEAAKRVAKKPQNNAFSNNNDDKEE